MRPVSLRNIEANRGSTQKSTGPGTSEGKHSRRGPKSEQGKQRVSLNAVQHGLTAKAIVIPGVERRDQWDAYRSAMMTALAPVGQLEIELANMVAAGLWRSRRIPRFERAAIVREIVVADHEQPEGEADSQLIEEVEARADATGHRRRCLVLEPGPLDRLVRYEAHLLRCTLKALHELEAQQARRLGRSAPLARIDVHGLGDA